MGDSRGQEQSPLSQLIVDTNQFLERENRSRKSLRNTSAMIDSPARPTSSSSKSSSVKMPPRSASDIDSSLQLQKSGLNSIKGVTLCFYQIDMFYCLIELFVYILGDSIDARLLQSDNENNSEELVVVKSPVRPSSSNSSSVPPPTSLRSSSFLSSEDEDGPSLIDNFAKDSSLLPRPGSRPSSSSSSSSGTVVNANSTRQLGRDVASDLSDSAMKNMNSAPNVKLSGSNASRPSSSSRNIASDLSGSASKNINSSPNVKLTGSNTSRPSSSSSRNTSSHQQDISSHLNSSSNFLDSSLEAYLSLEDNILTNNNNSINNTNGPSISSFRPGSRPSSSSSTGGSKVVLSRPSSSSDKTGVSNSKKKWDTSSSTRENTILQLEKMMPSNMSASALEASDDVLGESSIDQNSYEYEFEKDEVDYSAEFD